MDIARVCVIGGSGFVGSHIVQLLSAERYQVRVPTRNRERAKRLILLPTVDVVSANVHDEADLDHLVRGMGAVINLVGVLHGGRGAHSFSAAHVDLTRKIIAACGR
ncbi:MAG TPA: NAD(P)H-binding protein, partial [Burkholderiales bacterium]|nr:NAD(P)H-binding protein [Burkholderiales bacterium]